MLIKIFMIISFILSGIINVEASYAEGPTLPEKDQKAGLSRDQAILRYAKDCHAELKVIASKEEEEIKIAECKAYDTFQNCDFDHFSCSAKEESCKDDCAKPCQACQDTCAFSCDSCKALCRKNDVSCLMNCATHRADCRSTCLGNLQTCQESICKTSYLACLYDGWDEVKDCDFKNCEKYQEYVASSQKRNPDDELKNCKSQFPELCSGCGNYCFWPPTRESFFTSKMPTRSQIYDSLVKACTPKAQCPKDYKQALPFLDSFCAGVLTEKNISELTKMLTEKTISNRTLNMIFNAYGAMYGYQFKKKKWLNSFFYGSAKWLPDSCASRMKYVQRAKDMPLSMTKLRDKIKKIWKRQK